MVICRICRHPENEHINDTCQWVDCLCPLSGTPAGRPGVLEDGGSAGPVSSSPPARPPSADPSSPPPDSSGVMPREPAEVPHAFADLAAGTQTDDGAGAPPAATGEATSSPAPSSLTDRMRVERCRVLLDQWRKDRLAIQPQNPCGWLVAAGVRQCEDELREALEGP